MHLEKSAIRGRSQTQALQDKDFKKSTVSENNSTLIAAAEGEQPISRGTAGLVADEYSVDRKTVYNDVHFGDAVRNIGGNCAVDLKRVVLSKEYKGTYKSYFIALAKLPEERQRELVQQATRDKKWPALQQDDANEEEDTITLPIAFAAFVASLIEQRGRDYAVEINRVLTRAVEGPPADGE
jgi:hypothetical protein